MPDSQNDATHLLNQNILKICDDALNNTDCSVSEAMSALAITMGQICAARTVPEFRSHVIATSVTGLMNAINLYCDRAERSKGTFTIQ